MILNVEERFWGHFCVSYWNRNSYSIGDAKEHNKKRWWKIKL